MQSAIVISPRGLLLSCAKKKKKKSAQWVIRNDNAFFSHFSVSNMRTHLPFSRSLICVISILRRPRECYKSTFFFVWLKQQLKIFLFTLCCVCWTLRHTFAANHICSFHTVALSEFNSRVRAWCCFVVLPIRIDYVSSHGPQQCCAVEFILSGGGPWNSSNASLAV